MHANEKKSWPIHAKLVWLVRLRRLKRLARTHLSPDDWRAFSNALAPFSILKPWQFPPDTGCVPNARLSAGHVRTLLRHGIVRRIRDDEPVVGMIVFTVPEFAKQRFRVIGEPLSNQYLELEEFERPRLASFSECLSSFANNKCFATLDFSAWYYQFPADPRNFAFAHGRCRYGFARMSMGARHSATVAQLAATAIAREAVRNTRVSVQVYIDNIRFCGSAAQVRIAVRQMFDVCKHVRATLNEKEENVLREIGSPTHEFLGVAYVKDKNRRDYVTLSDNFKVSLQECVNTAQASQRIPFWLIEKWYGKLRYAALVLDIPPCEFYYVIKFMRRRVAQVNDGSISRASDARPWRDTIPLMMRWTNLVLSGAPRCVTKVSSRVVHLYTDASRIGFGIVMIADGEVTSFGGRWSMTERKQHINELEILAVTKATQCLQTVLEDRAVHLHIDNTTAMFCIRKKSSKKYWVNKRISELYADSVVTFETVDYVSTDMNPADYYSRDGVDEPITTSQWLH